MKAKYIYYPFLFIWNILLIQIVISNWKGNIHFGYGISDLLVMGLVVISLIIIDFITILGIVNKSSDY
jgi:hypothetical protein